MATDESAGLNCRLRLECGEMGLSGKYNPGLLGMAIFGGSMLGLSDLLNGGLGGEILSDGSDFFVRGGGLAVRALASKLTGG